MKILNLFLLSGIFCSAAHAAGSIPLDVINPIGDETLGELFIKCPPTPTAGMPEMALFALRVGTDGINCNELRRLPEGPHDVSVNVSHGNLAHQMVSILKQQRATVELAGLHLDWDQSLLRVDIGPRPTIEVRGESTGLVRVLDEATSWEAKISNKPSFLPLFSDRISIFSGSIPVLDRKTLDLKAGELRDERLNLQDLRTKVVLNKPVSVFPDAINNSGKEVFLVYRSKALGPSARFHVPHDIYIGRWDRSGVANLIDKISASANTSQNWMFFPNSSGEAVYYEIVVNNTWMPLTGKPGETKEIQLKRLDVNDVLVTRENGTTYTVHGSYTVSVAVTDEATGAERWKQLEVPDWQGGSNDPTTVARTFATKTGLTVLPGKYKVVVSYTTEEGQRSDEYLVDMR